MNGPLAVMTKEQAKEAYRRAGSIRNLAKEFGVSYGTCWKVLHRHGITQRPGRRPKPRG